MSDDDSRTVADVWDHMTDTARGRLLGLGIDPAMPYEQFRRRLEMGERAEQTARYTAERVRTGWDPDIAAGWNACLDHIRGDP